MTRDEIKATLLRMAEDMDNDLPDEGYEFACVMVMAGLPDRACHLVSSKGAVSPEIFVYNMAKLAQNMSTQFFKKENEVANDPNLPI